MAYIPYEKNMSVGQLAEKRVGETYQTALNRWLESQQEGKEMFARAEEPLAEARELYAPGGGYGAGQKALIARRARETMAGGRAEAVSSGMWSGTNIAGLRARVGADVTQAELGVEDVRTERLGGALSELSGLRGAAAGQKTAMVDPFATTYMGVQAGLGQASMQKQASETASLLQYAGLKRQAKSKEKIAKMSLASKKDTDTSSKFEIPKLHL